MDKGLSAEQATIQLDKYGLNEIVKAKKLSGFLDFLSRFKNPLLIILIISAIISGVLGDPVTAGIIIFIVLVSVAIDFINTYKSQKAAEDLKKRVMITTTVLRDGVPCEIALSHVVPDDVVVLNPGDIIPADGQVEEAKDLFVNESQLTGESFPVEKEEGALVYMGSSVNTGKAFLLVKATGKNTKFSHIAETLIKHQEPTEFDRGIKEFSTLIMKLTFALVLFVFFVNTILKHGLFESFLFSIALAVGLTPELLPMIIAINLSKGSLAMARHGVIVKKLSAIQNFGNMDILCTDKTGTLTEDKIKLVKCVDIEGKDSNSVLLAAYINSILSGSFKSPLDSAIKDFKAIDISAYTKIDEIPFDFVRRRDSIVVSKDNVHTLIAKGAPEQILEICPFYGEDKKPITADLRASILKEYEDLSQDGFRVLGVAQKTILDNKKAYAKEDEKEMTFLGFVAFLDPPKESVTETLKILEKYGIEIKILTGDNELVTEKITREISLPVKGILMGSDITHLTDQELAIKAENTTIFARVSPDEKERIINVLKSRGHVVGFLGDGINDAPSLKAADVGISVNNAVDVAKDAADLILLKKSLQNLIDGVSEGRRTFANTLKYLMMSLSSNFGNMFSMAGASVLLPFLPMTAPQILLNNLLYDSSQLAIPTDNVDESYMIKPRKFKIRFIKLFMLIFGPISSVFDFLTFFILLSVFHFGESAFQTGWFLESIATQAFVVYIIRTKKIPFFQSSPSKSLVMSTVLAVGVACSIVYLPFKRLFGFTSLPWPPMLAITLTVIVYLFVTEIAKRWFYRKIVTDD
ncbi:MAG: magnesium-translocating P-type ATPase [Candidatus Pacebacteria bacterium]|nr:magnesium-translocating P-type ATPase [Candidatus Paceibacterota bacterium]